MVSVYDVASAARPVRPPKGKHPSVRVLLTERGRVIHLLASPVAAPMIAGKFDGERLEVKGRLVRAGNLLSVASVRKMPKADKPPIEREAGQAKVVRGKVVCACALKEYESGANCKPGHYHRLMLPDGRILSFIPSETAQPLYLGGKYHFKNVKITGTVFAHAKLLDVSKVELEEK